MQKTFLGLMFSFAISGPVHTYPYIFENEEFFLCFRNAISVRMHGAYSNRFRLFKRKH